MPPKSERFELRLDEILQERIDQHCSENNLMNRAEAVRDLIRVGLDKSSRHSVQLSDGEKLIIAMIADLYRSDARQREIDPDEVMTAIHGGHTWALKWEHLGLFHDHVDRPGAVSLVVDVLDMWHFIEEAYDRFSEAEQKRVAEEVGPLGNIVKFAGFDGNNETEYYGIADQLVRKMGRFNRFADRSLNSHRQTVPRYARMARKFEPMRANLHQGGLSVSQVIELLKSDAD